MITLLQRSGLTARRSYRLLAGLTVLTVVALCATSCRPEGVLHSWEMRDVIVDLHKTEALLQVTGVPLNGTEAKQIYYAQVLEKHGITQAQFDSSIVWYTAHPQLFDKIYPRVMAKLEKEEAQLLEDYPELTDYSALINGYNAILNRHKKGEEPEEPTFTHIELDSVLWVTQHGYGNSWNHWLRPIPLAPKP